MIAAIGSNNEIGRNNELLWHLPDDFQWFIKHTKYKTVVMGRNTMMSLGKPLKNRRNVVLSSKNENLIEGFEYGANLEELIHVERQAGTEELMIIGGGQLYAYAMPLSNRLYITRVNANFTDADTFFPEFNSSDWELLECTVHEKDERHAYAFELQIWDRN
jgi:dihydrofolate reductase